MSAMRPQDYWRYPSRDLLTRYGASLLTYNTQVGRDFAAHAADVMGLDNRIADQIRSTASVHTIIGFMWVYEKWLRAKGEYTPHNDRRILNMRLDTMDATDALCLAYYGCLNDGIYVVQDVIWDKHGEEVDKEHVVKFLSCGAEMNNVKYGFLERLFSRAVSANQIRGMIDIMELSKENISMQSVIIGFKNCDDFGAILARVVGVLNGGA